MLALAAGVSPAQARRPRPITIRIPRFAVPPHRDREVKTAVRIPRRSALDIAGLEVVNRGANPAFSTHHFLAFAYLGAVGFPLERGRRRAWDRHNFPAVPDTQQLLIGGSQTFRKRQLARRGLALRLQPIPRTPGSRRTDVWIILDAHWVNGSSETQHASVVVKLIPAPRPIKRLLKPIFEVTANAALAVAPHTVRSTEASTRALNDVLSALHLPALEDAWGPGRFGLQPYAVQIGGATIPKTPACVTFLSAHMHKRGTFFAVDFVDSDGVVKNGPQLPALENPYQPGRYHFFVSSDYDDPAEHPFEPPVLLLPGQRFHYACWHDNGVRAPLKLGCEERSGVTPGQSIADAILRGGRGAATPCSRPGPDPEACPPAGPFTGNCVEANLVFGYTADDDMCILPGAYYDANPDAPPGRECDLALLSPASTEPR